MDCLKVVKCDCVDSPGCMVASRAMDCLKVVKCDCVDSPGCMVASRAMDCLKVVKCDCVDSPGCMVASRAIDCLKAAASGCPSNHLSILRLRPRFFFSSASPCKRSNHGLVTTGHFFHTTKLTQQCICFQTILRSSHSTVNKICCSPPDDSSVFPVYSQVMST